MGTRDVLLSWVGSMGASRGHRPQNLCSLGGRMQGLPIVSGCVLGCRTTYPVTPIQGPFGKASRGHQCARPPQWLALTAKSMLD